MVVRNEVGQMVFRMFRPGAANVQVLGDFTGWHARAVAMASAGDGWWEAEVGVPPGDHLFSYLIDSHHWLPDYAAHGIKANGFGGWVSQLHVAGERVAAMAA